MVIHFFNPSMVVDFSNIWDYFIVSTYIDVTFHRSKYTRRNKMGKQKQIKRSIYDKMTH